MQNLKPLGDRVVIEPSPKEKQTKSGIVIPDTAEGKPMEGKIIAIGPGRLNEKGERVPMSVKVGDIVLFKKYGPEEFESEGVKYLVAEEGDLIAVVS
ncbi:co-chaperone GroES [Candidatus Jorgensenbacteria bacterium GWA1_54_12]|uniref:Co-chaperonin GroES n=1 Tax=Candidatus Jorgensenbacteria bacterium GWA1_54_12 TaxID=1798468 RepID=A0A1F6BL80_9BACT|nr:MAG: co-chaperone GroES [Candidatus Jorgensenbacteria bacterium GWA1_54_12]